MKVFTRILIIFVLGEVVRASIINKLVRNEWNDFKLEHKKIYGSIEEERYRLSIYLENRDLIAQHNQRYALGLETYEMGLNHLADLTYEEVVQLYTGLEAS
jgi:cathepsin L